MAAAAVTPAPVQQPGVRPSHHGTPPLPPRSGRNVVACEACSRWPQVHWRSRSRPARIARLESAVAHADAWVQESIGTGAGVRRERCPVVSSVLAQAEPEVPVVEPLLHGREAEWSRCRNGLARHRRMSRTAVIIVSSVPAQPSSGGQARGRRAATAWRRPPARAPRLAPGAHVRAIASLPPAVPALAAGDANAPSERAARCAIVVVTHK